LKEMVVSHMVENEKNKKG